VIAGKMISRPVQKLHCSIREDDTKVTVWQKIADTSEDRMSLLQGGKSYALLIVSSDILQP
jgi:hypothetical protein